MRRDFPASMPDARKDNGGARKGAGRPTDKVQRKRRGFYLSDTQYEKARQLGGSAWLQGLLNLQIR